MHALKMARVLSTLNSNKNKGVGPWTYQKLRCGCSFSFRHLTVQVPCPPSADDIHVAQVCILLNSIGTVVHGVSIQALAKIQNIQVEPANTDRIGRCQVQAQQKLEGRCTGHAAASNMWGCWNQQAILRVLARHS